MPLYWQGICFQTT